MTRKTILALIGIGILVSSCGKLTPYKNEENNSSFTEDESHYEGQNCVDCHYSAGKGEGWFNVSGTIYGNTNLSTVELYEDLGTDPIKVLEVDQRGNFYTTDSIDFSQGLYAVMHSADGQSKTMGSQLFIGQCNLCHGVNTSKLEFP